MTTEPSGVHYQRPGWFTRNVFNRTVQVLTAAGVSVLGSRVLEVRGRSTGETRRTPVNLLTLDGRQYLVAPRGETNWVRNVRADGGRLTLRLGRRRQPFVGRELDTEESLPVLRAYLKRWKAEVGVFFHGVGPDSTDEDLRREAERHPVFEITPG